MNREFADLFHLTNYFDKEYGERIAYKFYKDGSVKSKTYHQFTMDINGAAFYFHERNKENARYPVALIGNSSYEWMVYYLGILKSNNVAVPCNPLLSKEELTDILNQVQVKYVLLGEKWYDYKEYILEHCKYLERVLFLQGDFEEITKTKGSIEVKINPEEICQYAFTSGTTAGSKVVTYSYRNILSAIGPERLTPFQLYDTNFSILPVHHCFELFAGQLMSLAYGCTICIDDRLENIKTFQPTMMCVVPLLAEELIYAIKKEAKKRGLDFKENDWSVIKRRTYYKDVLDKVTGGKLFRIFCGGAKVRSEIPKWFDWVGISFYQGFGMTELTGAGLMNLTDTRKFDSVGVSVGKDLQVKIAEDGELLFKGPSVIKGYYKIDNRPFFTEDGFLRTGDFAIMDEEGYVSITGRKKNVIILKTGENVYPEEIETHLKSIPEVSESLVLEWKEQIAAVIYSEDQANQEIIEEKINELNRGVPGYKRITKVFFRNKPFPTTSIGKIKRPQVMEELEAEDTVEYIAATTKTQKKIVKVVSELLDIEGRISILDNFFALGGSSLTALKLGAKLKIQAQWVYEYPILVELATFIDGNVEQKQEEQVEVNSWILKNQNQERRSPVKEVVLTGATGFLGSHILFELLKHKDIHVTCLIRNEEKFRTIYKFYFNEEVPSGVSVLIGDITKEYMGIEKSVYRKLAEKVDTVIHAAANVHHVGDLKEFMNTNYMGTEVMIKLCKDADASLQFISSYAVSGIAVVPVDFKQHVFNEDTLYIGQEYKQNVYVHTKYLSEKKIIMERQNGIRANIYRIGCLTSRKSDGVFQLNEGDNGLRNRLRGLWKTRIYTKKMAQYPIDFTYVDECAQAVVKLTLYSKENNIYQLYNPNMVRFADLEEVYNRNGFLDKWSLVSQEEFNEQMDSMVSDKEIAEYAFYHSMAMASTPIPMDCKKTLNQLRKLSFQWSNVEDRYIMQFIGANI